MGDLTFQPQAAIEPNSKEKASPRDEALCQRATAIYRSEHDIRSEYGRDYTRILHSGGYRRLKHKTQVFFNAAGNDHICTRMEHVAHVESVAYTIGQALGLNLELIKAIAMAHDLGHAPFGHHGESVLSQLSQEHLGRTFWHEQNGVRMVDYLELLPDHQGHFQNLNLTYAVRDGILSHCGELDENGLIRRDALIDLALFDAPGKYQAATWEGCVVKLADKIAYLGRDIEDATTLGYFTPAEREELIRVVGNLGNSGSINTTSIMHTLIYDLCQNSSLEQGLCFSSSTSDQLNAIKQFNYEHIYRNKRLRPYQHYAELVINELFDYLISLYKGADTLREMVQANYHQHEFVNVMAQWMSHYCTSEATQGLPEEWQLALYDNQKIYQAMNDKQLYTQAVLDFIAGMTDAFAVKAFEELLKC